ncbi:MAG TPA: patatin-like phospholipase family protein, partial [Holophaga sp.]|nr:patatin-like phospholipase family protein [Holophaga sp.]
MRMIRSAAALLLCACSLAGEEAAVLRLSREEPDYAFRLHPVFRVEGQRPFALALRGGIARGFTHLGVFQGLDDENLAADAIVGTSIGGLMGSLYASGFSADGIAQLFSSRDFGRVFDDRLREPGWSLSEDETMHATPNSLRSLGGKPDLLPGKATSRHARQALMPMLARAAWLADGDFDRLRVPFRAVASDLTSGGGKAFAKGSLVDAVMASLCMPGIFAPVEIEGHQYVDGGPFENLPVLTSRREFPGMLQVGVAIGRAWDGQSKNNLVSLLDASLDLAMAQTEERSLAAADLIIRPEVASASDFDFHRQVASLSSLGRRAFDDRRPVLEDLIYGPKARQRAAASLRLEATGVPGAQAWFESVVAPGAASFGDLYRALRKAHRELPVSDAFVRLPASPEGAAMLELVPARTIGRFEIDLPGDWPASASGLLAEELRARYGLAPGLLFDENAWSRALEELLVEGVLNQVPILDLRGSGFTPDGTLRLRLREPRIERITTQDPVLQADFDRLFADLKAGPVRTTTLAASVSRTTARLGLSRL